MSDDGNKKFLDALKAEFLKAAKETSPLMFPVLPAPGKSGVEFQSHLRWIEEKARAMYGVPASMLTPVKPQSGLAMELAAEYRAQQQIKGRTASWVTIDEAPVHPNCRCEPVPVAASSLNVSSAHDDMLDALAISFGLRRKQGEDDADFRHRVRAMMGTRHRDVRSVASEFEGVLGVRVNEVDPGKVKLTVTLEPKADRPRHRDAIAHAVEEARSAGVAVDVEFEVAPVTEKDDDTEFIRRLRSKILEQYPEGE